MFVLFEKVFKIFILEGSEKYDFPSFSQALIPQSRSIILKSKASYSLPTYDDLTD